ncbi:fimbria/pilus outer membrane usher protein [Scandinavium sp. NPDC088450]|uniref:fimbria/pilus outer membrane usher protein n=1 Tax=Scandinavium sp. NPDC088450 TaxID=3364514 RepID=UPI0038503292
MMIANSLKTSRPGRLAVLMAIALGSLPEVAWARDTFNPGLLELDNPGAGKIDLSAYESGSQAAGRYHVDVIVADQVVDTVDIDFTASANTEGESELVPCLSVVQLKQWGVKTDQFPALKTEGECANLAAIPLATSDFQFSTQRLVLSIPQAALMPVVRGWVAPELWDEGINAAMLNYSVSGTSSWGEQQSSNTQYANLRPGINIGPWRLRNYTTWNRDSEGKDKWATVYTYLNRDVIPLKAQLTAGDSSAPADVFDSMPFRGVQLASDDDMLPDSLKGYAPVIRGIARTNAQVVIRQNGYVIYQNAVAPGAFEITDMYPTGGAGDFEVTVQEADGSEQHFVVPYASLPVLQREGRSKYALTGGLYRSYDNSVDKTPFAQLTNIYGLPKGFTLYGGIQESTKYQSVAAGLGKNMGDIGAVSVDITQAWSSPKNNAQTSGQSWRARYSKNIVASGTNFAIAGYRYSTSGFYGMQEVLDTYSDKTVIPDRRRNRMELSVSQALGNELGSLMLSAVREDYWHSGQAMKSYSAGYNNAWRGISYGLTYTWSQNGTSSGSGSQTSRQNDRQLALNISVPLEKFLPNSWANYSLNNSKNGGTTHQIGVSGMALENNALSWNVQQGYGSDNVGYTGNMTGDYKGSYGEANAGYAYDQHTQRLNYGLQGGVMAHADGVTFSQPLGETNVLIKAPGAKGVNIQNQSGAKTDWRGYTVTSNLTPFRKNDVALRTDSLPDDVELELTNTTVTPTRGAVVRAEYVANVGLRALITLTQANGQPVPFGAVVTLLASAHHGGSIVGEGGQVYLAGLDAQGHLAVSWGKASSQQCKVDYAFPGPNKDAVVINANFICH